MAIGNPGKLFAGCVAVDNDLSFNICAEYQGTKYQIPFTFFQHDTGFYWKADDVAAKQVQSGDNCIRVENDLNLKFSCADYQGVGYAFILNHAAYPNDTSGLYWKMDTSSFSTSYVIVDTGQSKCYNALSETSCPSSGTSFYGQDAQYMGNQPSYKNNGDGTITDLSTGLMWVQARGLKITWDAAVAGAATNRTGGYSDWRMPTIKESYSLIQFSGMNGPSVTSTDGYIPFIDTNYFEFVYGPGTSTSVRDRVIDCQDWSATEYVSTVMNGQVAVFGVNFADGRIKGYNKYIPNTTVGNTLYVRYVRGNSAYGTNHFVNNGDGTVTDLATGLMWSQSDSGTGYDWPGALAWVQAKDAANYLGYSDWRLPNIKELVSIVDYTRSPNTTATPAIDTNYFVSTAITNEAGQTDYPYFWSSTILLDGGPTPSGTYISFGRAMGYMNGAWIDVHGAGSQKSDILVGDPTKYPTGRGPQGDAVRIYNYVRLVRDID